MSNLYKARGDAFNAEKYAAMNIAENAKLK
jgi:hypothetical protein